MRMYGLSLWKARFKRWVMRRTSVAARHVLGLSNLYILPSYFGFLYAFVLLAIFVGAINYQLSAAFFFSFLLLVLGIMSIWLAHRNLQDLEITFVEVSDVAAMQAPSLSLFVRAAKGMRVNLHFMADNLELGFIEALPAEGAKLILALPSRPRGVYELPLIRLSSEFPFGLLRVWGYLRFPGMYYVYPELINPGFLPEALSVSTEGRSKSFRAGDEALDELKAVSEPWSQKGRIAWKISARGQGYFVKSMLSEQGLHYLLKLNMSEGSFETRLSHLAYWLVALEQMGLEYGLDLPVIKLPLGHGPRHLEDSLRGLARVS